MLTRSPRELLRANTLTDALGTAYFIGGSGYLAAAYLHLSVSASLASASVGALIGTVGSLVTASLCDTLGAKPVLVVLQGTQILVAAGLLLRINLAYTAIFFGANFALSRMVSPVRGTLPPQYLSKDDLMGYKTQVRTLTLIFIGISTLLVSASALFLNELPGAFSSVFAILNSLSFVGCLILTVALPKGSGGTRRFTHPFINLGRRGFASWALLVVGFATAGATKNTLPYIAARAGRYGALLLVAEAVIGIGFGALAQRVSALQPRTLGVGRSMGNLAISLGSSTFSIGLLLIVFASLRPSSLPLYAVCLIAVIFSELALTILTIVSWNMQYGIGPDSRRGVVVGLFTLATSIGTSLSAGVGSGVARL